MTQYKITRHENIGYPIIRFTIISNIFKIAKVFGSPVKHVNPDNKIVLRWDLIRMNGYFPLKISIITKTPTSRFFEISFYEKYGTSYTMLVAEIKNIIDSVEKNFEIIW